MSWAILSLSRELVALTLPTAVVYEWAALVFGRATGLLHHPHHRLMSVDIQSCGCPAEKLNPTNPGLGGEHTAHREPAFGRLKNKKGGREPARTLTTPLCLFQFQLFTHF